MEFHLINFDRGITFCLFSLVVARVTGQQQYLARPHPPHGHLLSDSDLPRRGEIRTEHLARRLSWGSVLYGAR